MKASKRACLQVLAPKVLARSDASYGSPAGSSSFFIGNDECCHRVPRLLSTLRTISQVPRHAGA